MTIQLHRNEMNEWIDKHDNYLFDCDGKSRFVHLNSSRDIILIERCFVAW